MSIRTLGNRSRATVERRVIVPGASVVDAIILFSRRWKVFGFSYSGTLAAGDCLITFDENGRPSGNPLNALDIFFVPVLRVAQETDILGITTSATIPAGTLSIIGGDDYLQVVAETNSTVIIGVDAITAAVNADDTVSGGNVAILAANANRKGFTIRNKGDTRIHLNFGAVATTDNLFLDPGDAYEHPLPSGFVNREAINCIDGAVPTIVPNVQITEWE